MCPLSQIPTLFISNSKEARMGLKRMCHNRKKNKPKRAYAGNRKNLKDARMSKQNTRKKTLNSMKISIG
jgi:hypothetical protein